MKVVLDHNLDWRLKRLLPGHEVVTAKDMGWEEAGDGDFLAVAEAEFDVLLTDDKNLRHQQNLLSYNIALVVLDVRQNILPIMTAFLPSCRLSRQGKFILCRLNRPEKLRPTETRR